MDPPPSPPPSPGETGGTQAGPVQDHWPVGWNAICIGGVGWGYKIFRFLRFQTNVGLGSWGRFYMSFMSNNSSMHLQFCDLSINLV